MESCGTILSETLSIDSQNGWNGGDGSHWGNGIQQKLRNELIPLRDAQEDDPTQNV